MGVMHFVPVGDTKLALHDLGGSGRPLLILHCNGFPARTYLPLVRHLLLKTARRATHMHVTVVRAGHHIQALPVPATAVSLLGQARRLATAYHCYGLDFRGHDESAHAPWLPPLARPTAADAPLRTEHPAGEGAACNLDHFVDDLFAVVQWLRSRGLRHCQRPAPPLRPHNIVLKRQPFLQNRC